MSLTTGAITEIGELRVNVNGTNGFDISSDNIAYAALTVGTKTSLYTINTTTGIATVTFDFANPIVAFTLGLY